MTSRFETYSFLPPPSKEMIDAHIEHMLKKDLVPLIEYSEENTTLHGFWHQWHLPKNTRSSLALVQQMLRQCVHANPQALVRLSGYDTQSRTCEVSFIVRTPDED